MRPERPPPPLDPEARQRDQLATFLVVTLSLLVGGSFVMFLIFVSLGLFLWVIVTAAGIAVFTGLHYLIWGRSIQSRRSAEDGGTIDVPPVRPAALRDVRTRHDEPGA